MLAVAAGLAPGVSAGEDTAGHPGDRPYALECYYRAKWGHADEFIALFRKNHLPVLRSLMEKGRILKVSAVKPRYHATEDGRPLYEQTGFVPDARWMGLRLGPT